MQLAHLLYVSCYYHSRTSGIFYYVTWGKSLNFSGSVFSSVNMSLSPTFGWYYVKIKTSIYVRKLSITKM